MTLYVIFFLTFLDIFFYFTSSFEYVHCSVILCNLILIWCSTCALTLKILFQRVILHLMVYIIIGVVKCTYGDLLSISIYHPFRGAHFLKHRLWFVLHDDLSYMEFFVDSVSTLLSQSLDDKLFFDLVYHLMQVVDVLSRHDLVGFKCSICTSTTNIVLHLVLYISWFILL